MKKNKYVVFSAGKIVDGADRDHIVRYLATRFGITDKKVKSELLNGSPRKIRTFYDKAKAEKVAAKLRREGLDTFVEKPTESSPALDAPTIYHSVTVEDGDTTVLADEGSQEPDTIIIIDDAPIPEPDIDLPTANNPIKQGRSRPLKVFVTALCVLVLVGVALAFYAYDRVRVEEPPRLIELETRLFDAGDPSLVFFAHPKKIRSLAALGDDQAVDANSSEYVSRWLLESAASSSYLVDNTDLVVGTFTLSDSTQAKSAGDWLAVLSGHYDRESVIQEMQAENSVVTLERDVLEVRKTVKLVDEFTCPLSDEEQRTASARYFHIGPDEVLVSTSQALLNSALSNTITAVSDNPILAEWVGYRQGAVMAIKMFREQSLNAEPMARAVKERLFGDSNLRSISAKVTPSLLARGAEVAIHIESNDSTELKGASKTISEGIQSLMESSQESMPSVARLMSRVRVESSDSLMIAAKLDSDLLGDIATLGTEVFQSMFQFEVTSDPNAPAPVEVIDDNAWDYMNNPKLIESKDYEVGPMDRSYPLFTGQGIAIFMDFVGIDPTVNQMMGRASDDTLRLSLKAKRSIPNLQNSLGINQSGLVQTLMITNVQDASGNTLVRDERCIERGIIGDKNHVPSTLSNVNNNVMETDKTVRLASGTLISDIDTVTGWVEVDVPTQVSKQTLSLAANDVAKWESGSLQIKSIQGGDVNYQVIGEDRPLVHVRALNAAGKPLQSGSAFWTKGHYSRQFKGEVAAIEVFIAEQWHNEKIEFTLASIKPKPVVKSKQIKPTSTIQLFAPSQAARFNSPLDFQALPDEEFKRIEQDLGWKGLSLDGSKPHEIGRTVTQSAHLFFKHDNTSAWRNQLEGAVLLPFDPAITDHPNALTIRLRDGDSNLATVHPTFRVNRFNGVPQPSFDVAGQGYLLGQFTVDLPEDVKRLDSIQGNLDYQLPVQTRSSVEQLPDGQPSRNVQLASLSYGWSNKASYTLREQIPGLTAAKFQVADGTEYLAEIDQDVDGALRLNVDTTELPARIELFTVAESHNINETFQLIPQYQESPE